MADVSFVTTLSQHLERGIVFLERLHVLSQTEALILERSAFEELAPLVLEKERLVSQIDGNRESLATVIGQATTGLSELPAPSREALESLKQRGLQLVELIERVDQKNLLHLETFKEQAVESSRILHEDQTLRRAYNVPGGTMPQFSRVVD